MVAGGPRSGSAVQDQQRGVPFSNGGKTLRFSLLKKTHSYCIYYFQLNLANILSSLSQKVFSGRQSNYFCSFFFKNGSAQQRWRLGQVRGFMICHQEGLGGSCHSSPDSERVRAPGPSLMGETHGAARAAGAWTYPWKKRRASRRTQRTQLR